jgi:hypothetical protein
VETVEQLLFYFRAFSEGVDTLDQHIDVFWI